MAENSTIQWTTHTFNPWWGCEKASPACAHCYAESFAKRVGQKVWGGESSPRRFFGDKHWDEPLKWNRLAARGVLDDDWHRPRVFCASMADVFEDRDDLIPHRARLFELIEATPNLDWLLLTKRPENVMKHVEEIIQRIEACDDYKCDDPKAQAARDWLADWLVLRRAPANVWIGTTVENQEYAEKRIPELLRVPASVRFLSCEPLLGPLDLQYPETIWPDGPQGCCSGRECGCMGMPIDPPLIWGINWIITGGESGGKARPTNLDWFRSLRDQCSAAGVAFFMKQLGGVHDARGDIDAFPEDLRIRQFPNQ
jgi:protein gp37